MPDDDTLALVNGVPDEGGLFVGFTDGSWHGIVKDETENARVGDVVQVEPRSYGSDEYQAVTVVKEGGWDIRSSLVDFGPSAGCRRVQIELVPTLFNQVFERSKHVFSLPSD